MAAAVQVPGAALIKIDAQQGAGLESLGYTINGADITHETFWGNVPGDQNGGDEGPPIAIQYFGEIARVRLELSKWDSAVAAKIEARVTDKSAGVIGTAGDLLDGTGSNHCRLVIASASLPRNFLFAIPRDAIEQNRGSKFARLVLNFECHALSGTLWNTTTS